MFFSAADAATRTYRLDGSLDGGAGKDTLSLNFGQGYWYHAFGGNTWNQIDSPPWHFDLSHLAMASIESIVVTGYDLYRSWAYPIEIRLSASQLAGLTNLSGIPALGILGGGAIDLALAIELAHASASASPDKRGRLGRVYFRRPGRPDVVSGRGDHRLRHVRHARRPLSSS